MEKTKLVHVFRRADEAEQAFVKAYNAAIYAERALQDLERINPQLDDGKYVNWLSMLQDARVISKRASGVLPVIRDVLRVLKTQKRE